MKTMPFEKFAVVGVVFFAMTTVQAQQVLLQEYSGLLKALTLAETAQSQKKLDVALSRLGEAQNRFDRFSSDIQAQILVEGINGALDRTKTAATRSLTDLKSQSALVQGLVYRALQEELLNQLDTQGNESQAIAFGSAIGREYRLSVAARAQLLGFVQSNNIEGARTVLQRQAAQNMLSNINLALSARDKNSAFLNTAQALGWFMNVQGAPEVTNIDVDAFSVALGSLAQGSPDAFKKELGQIQSSARTLIATLDPAEFVGKPVENPVQGTDPSPVVKPPVTQTAPIVLQNEGLYASLSKALISVANADILQARQSLLDAKDMYGKTLQAKFQAQDADQNQRIVDLFDKLQGLPGGVGLRTTDIEGLITLINQAETNLQSNTVEAVPLRTTLGILWSGLPRSLIFIAIAILSIFPLRYLNLAFGGRNRYWRFIGVSMVLLFVPAIVEGVAQLGSLLSELTGMRFFDLLSSFSVLQNAGAQFVWSILLLGASGFAIAGFRGICIQFGLIRSGKHTYFTQLETTTGSSPEDSNGEKKPVSWDEEF